MAGFDDTLALTQPAFIQNVALGVLQLLVTLLLAPFINTLLKKMNACFQGRKGPPLLQGYYDLLKYFHKETVLSDQTTWLFSISPYLIFTVMCVVALIIPTFMAMPHIQVIGGIVVVVYMFGLARFFMVSSALETGGGFCGMASGREMMLSCLVEPAMLLSLFVIAIIAGSTNMEVMFSHLSTGEQLFSHTPSYMLALLALLLTSLAEMARVPFDNPETHYELTMIHEGMLLEYSGQPLGMMLWGGWIKQLLILSILANFVFPFGIISFTTFEALGIGLFIYLLKLLVVCVLVALIETIIAKMRLFKVKDYLGAAFALALLALTLSIHKTLTGGLF